MSKNKQSDISVENEEQLENSEIDQHLAASDGLEEVFEEELSDDELAKRIAAEEADDSDIVIEAEEVTDQKVAEGTELETFESAEIEDKEFLEHDQVLSIIESVLFATDKPQSLTVIRQAFKGTTIKSKDIRKAIEELMVEYAGGNRGITLEEVNGGYQLRTKIDNMKFIKRMIKGRSFRLSGPALEVLAITSYKQPCIKAEIDEIRGVESGHLLRGLMERGMVTFAGKSEAPGKPMLYGTTKKFLEIFGLRNLKELPSLSEIDQLIPEGIGEAEEEKETLDQLTDGMSEKIGSSYSEGEEELTKITDQLGSITTSSDFFEQEKQRQKEKREREKAEDIRDAIAVGEEVSTRDKNYLTKWETTQEEKKAAKALIDEAQVESENIEDTLVATSDAAQEITEKDSVEEMSADEIAQVIAASEEDIEVPEGKLLVNAHDDDLVNKEAAAKIGEVDFKKMEKDLEVFNQEVETSPLDDEQQEDT